MTELDELISFLSSPSLNVKKAAVDIVHGLTGTDEGIAGLCTKASALVSALLRMLADVQVLGKTAAECLVNLSQKDEIADALIKSKSVDTIMEILSKQKASGEINKLLVMLLVNLTQSDTGLKCLLQDSVDKMEGLYVNQLTRIFYKSSASDKGEDDYEHIASVLVNLTRHETGRRLLLDNKRGLLKQVLYQADSKSVVRRRGVIGIVRNCCFYAEHENQSLLYYSDLLWPCLLLPVAGSQVYAEHDLAKMPPELATPLSFAREGEKDFQIRAEALDALYLLVLQDAGRKAFWGINGPRIIQVGYESEEDPEVMNRYERLGALVIADAGGQTDV